MKLNDLDLNKLNVFVAAAQAGSFAAAAEQLRLSRSAVSQAIGALEQSLDLRLFDRVGRGTVLTERGQQLLERVAAYQAGLQAVISDLTHSDDTQRRGMVRLGLFIGFSHTRLDDFLAEFLARYPLAGVKVLFLPHAELAARLVERKLDAALSIYPLDRQARVLESRRLLDQELILVSGRKLHVANPSLRQIRQLPIVDYYESGELTRTWIRHHYRVDPGALRVRAHVGTVEFVRLPARADRRPSAQRASRSFCARMSAAAPALTRFRCHRAPARMIRDDEPSHEGPSPGDALPGASALLGRARGGRCIRSLASQGGRRRDEARS